MKDPEIDLLINALESNPAMTIAELDGVAGALTHLLPGLDAAIAQATLIAQTDGAMHVADAAYPNWVVNIRGRADDRDGHWRCMLRENDARDNDAVIGHGRSPVLAQAILAAILRLSMIVSKSSSTHS